MVRMADIFSNDIADVSLVGVAPVVQAENLCLIRRYDRDNPNDGLLLMLLFADPTRDQNIIAGRLVGSIQSRSCLLYTSPSPRDS